MDEDERTEPPHAADERATLTGFLQYQRETLAWKCSGVTAEQLRHRAVPPSDLSLIGMIRHLTDVEQAWFRRVLNGEDIGAIYWGEDPSQATDFAVEGTDTDEAFRLWHKACAHSREIVAACETLDVTGLHRRSGSVYSLRWILTHMIEEYARHNGPC